MEATIVVGKEISNMMGGMHGGAYATLADELSTYAIMSLDKHFRGSVSVNLSVNYLTSAPTGSTVTCEVVTVSANDFVALKILLRRLERTWLLQTLYF